MFSGGKVVGSDRLLPMPYPTLAIFYSLHLRMFYWPNCINRCYSSHFNCNSTRSDGDGIYLCLNPITNARAFDTDQWAAWAAASDGNTRDRPYIDPRVESDEPDFQTCP